MEVGCYSTLRTWRKLENGLRMISIQRVVLGICPKYKYSALQGRSIDLLIEKRNKIQYGLSGAANSEVIAYCSLATGVAETSIIGE